MFKHTGNLKGQCGIIEAIQVFHYFTTSEIMHNQSFTENIRTS